VFACVAFGYALTAFDRHFETKWNRFSVTHACDMRLRFTSLKINQYKRAQRQLSIIDTYLENYKRSKIENTNYLIFLLEFLLNRMDEN